MASISSFKERKYSPSIIFIINYYDVLCLNSVNHNSALQRHHRKLSSGGAARLLKHAFYVFFYGMYRQVQSLCNHLIRVSADQFPK